MLELSALPLHPKQPSRVNVKPKLEAMMRFVLCIVLVALLPTVALAASGGSMSVSSAQAAAAKGDQKAAAALATTTDHDTCMSGCASRGHSKGQCVTACRPGLCHPGGEQPYCVSK